MIDDRTTHYTLALPHSNNRLDEDVERLRDALNAIDEAIDGVSDGSSVIADQVIAGVSGAYTYDGGGRVSSISETLTDGSVRTTAFIYNGDGTVQRETVTVGGTSWVTTYAYTGGLVSGYTRVEQ